jgi:hypothetical protein
MGYDEFSEKLRKVKIEYELATGKPLDTISELEIFLDRKLLKPRTKGLKSLKGLNF